MRVAATTVIRHVGTEESSGRLLILEVQPDRVEVVAQARLPESPFRSRDRNPRGGTRGLRAVSALSGALVVADCSRIMTLDGNLAVVAEITHPLLGMVHAIAPDDAGVWAASTSADALVRLTWGGDLERVLRVTDLPGLATSLGLAHPDPLEAGPFDDPARLVSRVHDVAHPNAMWFEDDRIIIALGQALCRPDGHDSAPVRDREGNWTRPAGEWDTRHVILEVRESSAGPRATVLWDQPVAGVPNHDLLVRGDRFWFNDSGTREVVGVHRRDDVARVPVEGDFVRGLVSLDDQRVLVGTQSPLRVHVVDPTSRRTLFMQDLPGDTRESITCLATIPEGVTTP